MNFPPKIQKWLEKSVFPQRVLLSRHGDNLDLALHIASELQGTSMTEIEKGIHPDTRVFVDLGASFKIGEDGDDTESIRGMIKWCAQKPAAPKRLVILENIERASGGAFQALLKLVEEPPPQAVIIFTTQNHHQLLETILSRVTVVRLSRTPQEMQISEEIQQFFESRDLITKFQHIDQLVKQSKEAKDKNVLHNFLHESIVYARIFDKHHGKLDLLYETHRAFKQNVNAKLALERLAIGINNE